jgi:hypothetical protein
MFFLSTTHSGKSAVSKWFLSVYVLCAVDRLAYLTLFSNIILSFSSLTFLTVTSSYPVLTSVNFIRNCLQVEV